MAVTFDDEKRALTLQHRGLDFAHADQLFSGATLTLLDDRMDYGEIRYQTVGRLGGDVVMVVWTPRDESRRIISMRKCNVRERKIYEEQLG